MTISTSASSSSSVMCWSSIQDCSESSWFHGNAPLPPGVQMTGARSFSAMESSDFSARPRRVPPPAMMAGRSAVESHFTASRTSSTRGGLSAASARASSTGGTMMGSSSTFCGISSHTGPCGEEIASVQASWMAEGMPEACWISRWLLVTFAAEAFWSSSWCSMPLRRAPRPSSGIWLATTTMGTPVA